MLSKLKNRKQEGFTIIEVLIVLAIAGLILLVVFLAVPALQRNSRNTQRNNDIAGILGALNEYVNNNNGKLPTTSCSDKGTGAGKCDFLNNVNTGFYQDYTKISYKTNTAAVQPNGVVDLDTVVLQNYSKCSGTTVSGTTPSNTVTTTTGATARSVVALYAVEVGGSSAVSQQCKDL